MRPACLPRLPPLPRACPLQTIRGLERDKERFAAEAAGVNAQYKAAAEEVALRDAAILDLQRKIAGGLRVVGWWG